jgi:hypothetical protein
VVGKWMQEVRGVGASQRSESFRVHAPL